MSGEDVTRAWFLEFCKTPLIFHVSHLAGAVHHDILVSQTAWSESPDVLLHKTKAIQMVNEQLSHLSTLNHAALDRLIFTITTLSRHELEPKHLKTNEALLFSPQIPLANGMKLLGRLNCGAQARTVLVQLINSQGGLERLQIPGLANIIAL